MNKRKQIVKHKQLLNTVATLRKWMIQIEWIRSLSLHVQLYSHIKWLSYMQQKKKPYMCLFKVWNPNILPPVCFMYCHYLNIIFIKLLDLASYLKHCMHCNVPWMLSMDARKYLSIPHSYRRWHQTTAICS